MTVSYDLQPEKRQGGLLHNAHAGGWSIPLPLGYHLYHQFNSELAIATACNNISTSLQMYRLCGGCWAAGWGQVVHESSQESCDLEQKHNVVMKPRDDYHDSKQPSKGYQK